MVAGLRSLHPVGGVRNCAALASPYTEYHRFSSGTVQNERGRSKLVVVLCVLAVVSIVALYRLYPGTGDGGRQSTTPALVQQR